VLTEGAASSREW